VNLQFRSCSFLSSLILCIRRIEKRIPTSACNETNTMHYLSSVYYSTILLHVSDLLVAHHQEVTMYTRICNKWYVLVDCHLAS
jgi:hypothetical protein